MRREPSSGIKLTGGRLARGAQLRGEEQRAAVVVDGPRVVGVVLAAGLEGREAVVDDAQQRARVLARRRRREARRRFRGGVTACLRATPGSAAGCAGRKSWKVARPSQRARARRHYAGRRRCRRRTCAAQGAPQSEEGEGAGEGAAARRGAAGATRARRRRAAHRVRVRPGVGARRDGTRRALRRPRQSRVRRRARRA